MYCEKCGSAISYNAQGAAVGSGNLPAGSYPQPPQTNPYPPPGPQFQQPYQAQAPYVDPRVRGGTPVRANATYAVGKSAFLALFLSFLLPGVGQFYNGDTKRGLPMFLVGVFSLPLLALPVIGWAVVVGVHIWSMVNAFSVANQKTPLG